MALILILTWQQILPLFMPKKHRGLLQYIPKEGVMILLNGTPSNGLLYLPEQV